MVVGDRHYKHTDEGPVKNVRRNRSPPRNAEDGSVAPGTSNNDSADDCAVREGPEYQATIPEFNPSNQPLKLAPDSSYATMLWAPNSKTLDAKVDLYVRIAREKYGYDEEQALGLLFWHGHNVDRAVADLPNFTPVPNDWTVEDVVLFEQAFHFHGKNFHRVHLMLPDKSIGNLVKYYYLWKKIQYRVSVLDKRAQGTGSQCKNGGDKDAVEDSDSDFESAKEPLKEDATVEPVSAVGQSKVEAHGRLRNKHKPPPGIYINHDDLKVVAANLHGSQTDFLKPLEIEFDSLRRRVVANKQELASYKQRLSSSIDTFRPVQAEIPIIQKWTHSELLLAVQGVRRYGRNFAAIAEVLGNKTEHQVQNFFYSYRVQYNLDGVLREYEAEREKESGGITEEGPTDMDVDGPSSERANPSSSPPPPPLMKQFSSERSGHHQPESIHKPPVLHQAVKSTPLSGRMILHQPPPLFKHGTSVLSTNVATTK